jgi:hypothetical protein
MRAVAVFLLLTQLGAMTAPADRYFGRLKMSALRIRFETMQLKVRYETHELLPDQAQHLLLLTEDAFYDWAQRYPKDPWLASTGYSIAQLFQELPGRLARDHAVALLVYVKSRFPTTAYARKSRDQLHRGVWTKPLPNWAIVQSSITPSATPSEMPLATPAAAPSPFPSPTATRCRPVRPTAAR